jgi:hypothetical protein
VPIFLHAGPEQDARGVETLVGTRTVTAGLDRP